MAETGVLKGDALGWAVPWAVVWVVNYDEGSSTSPSGEDPAQASPPGFGGPRRGRQETRLGKAHLGAAYLGGPGPTSSRTSARRLARPAPRPMGAHRTAAAGDDWARVGGGGAAPRTA